MLNFIAIDLKDIQDYGSRIFETKSIGHLLCAPLPGRSHYALRHLSVRLSRARLYSKKNSLIECPN